MENAELMRQVIEGFVRKKGISIILTKTVIHGAVDVYYYNWVSPELKYYSLLVPCNATQILTENGVVSTAFVCDAEKALETNLRQFYSKEEWNIGKWNRRVAEVFNNTLITRLKRTYKIPEPINGYRVIDIKFYLQPCIGATIWYERESLQNFTVWLGYKTDLYTSEDGFKEFVDSFGFGESVTVHLLPNSKNKLVEEKIQYDDIAVI